MLWLGKQRVTERMHAALLSRRARAQPNYVSCGRSNAAPCAPHSQECIRCADYAKVPRCAHRFSSFVCLSAHYIRNKFDYARKLFAFGVRPAGRRRTPAFVVGRDSTRIIGLQCARIAWSSKIIRFCRWHPGFKIITVEASFARQIPKFLFDLPALPLSRAPTHPTARL